MEATVLDGFGFREKRVVVTGCSSGIGRATALLLLEAGADVHGIDWQRSDLPLTDFTQMDLRDRTAIDTAAATAEAPIHALFNCAGLPPMSSPANVMRVNFIGMRHFTEALVPLMPPGAAIATVGSNGGAGWRSRLPELLEFVRTPSFDAAVAWCEKSEAPRTNAYNFSKEAIVAWTLDQATTFIKHGIRINCTSPGAVQTPMLEAIEQSVPVGSIDAVAKPSGRRSTPEEQACCLLMLNSPLASYVNGVDLPVDGGFIAARTISEVQYAVPVLRP
jgi:NAD(P)-dependent dehydrogenase (short-subunit alcohol dehydrogenase family)